MTTDLRGTEIFGHSIVEMIGEGGMASVWRAEHPTLGSEVAVKALDPILARDESLVERFLDEARIQVHLQHPNIVKVTNFSQDPLAMVMEFIPGRPLSQVIGREVGPIPFERAMPIIRQMLSAVAYAHDKGVVHRDLKPSNILVTTDGTIKVMDFGIAKVLGKSGRTRTGASMGTPAYMAPEQIKGAKDVDARADIYALGVTIYEMLSGRVPFEGRSDTDGDFMLMQAQVSQPPPNPQEFYHAIPNPFVAVVLRALEKYPGNRQQSVQELLEDLEAAGAAQPMASNKPQPPTVVERPAFSAQRPPPGPPVMASDSSTALASGEMQPAAYIPAKSGPNMGLIAAIIGGAIVLLIGISVGVIMRKKSTPISPRGDTSTTSRVGSSGSESVSDNPHACPGYDSEGKPDSCPSFTRARSPRLQGDEAYMAVENGNHQRGICIAFDLLDRLDGSTHKYRLTYTSGAAYNIARVLRKRGCTNLACKWILKAFHWRMNSPRHGKRYISRFCNLIPDWGCGDAPNACN